MICPHRDCHGQDIPDCDWRAHAANHHAAQQRATHAARHLPEIVDHSLNCDVPPHDQCAAQTAYERHIYGP